MDSGSGGSGGSRTASAGGEGTEKVGVSCEVVGGCSGGMDSRLLGNDGRGRVEVGGARATPVRGFEWPQGEQLDHRGRHPRGMPLRNRWPGREWVQGITLELLPAAGGL